MLLSFTFRLACDYLIITRRDCQYARKIEFGDVGSGGGEQDYGMEGSEGYGKVGSDYYARAIGLAVGELITKTASEASEALPSRVDHPIHRVRRASTGWNCSPSAPHRNGTVR